MVRVKKIVAEVGAERLEVTVRMKSTVVCDREECERAFHNMLDVLHGGVTSRYHVAHVKVVRA